MLRKLFDRFVEKVLAFLQKNCSELVPTSWWMGGLVLSVALCVTVLSPLFHIPAWQIGTSALLACLIAVLAVRALGQTDLNPVSGVGKLSQIIFAVVAPGHVVANLVAGALLAFSFSMLEVSDSLILAQREVDYPITKAIYVLFERLGDGPGIAITIRRPM